MSGDLAPSAEDPAVPGSSAFRGADAAEGAVAAGSRGSSRPIVARLSAFAGAGALGFLVDAGLTEALFMLGMEPLTARLVAVATAITATFAVNRRMTWRSGARGRALFAEAGRYAAVALSASAVNYTIYAALMLALPDLRPLFAVATGSAVAMAVSYLGYARLVFAGR